MKKFDKERSFRISVSSVFNFVFCIVYFALRVEGGLEKKVDKARPSCHPALRNADTRVVSWVGEDFKGFKTGWKRVSKGLKQVETVREV